MNPRTKSMKSKYIFSQILNWILCFGTAATLIAILFCSGSAPSASLVESIGTIIYSFLVANIPLIILAIVVKDKIKPTVWMANVIMANIAFPTYGLYVTFGIWLIDTYVVTPLKTLYQQKYRINKEIDLRDGEQ